MSLYLLSENYSKNNRLKFGITIASFLFLNACSSKVVQHEDNPLLKAQKAPENVTILAPTKQMHSTVNANTLNQLLSTKELDSLISEAFENNPSIQKNWLTLQIRQAEKKRIDGNQKPSVSAGLDNAKVKDTDISFTGSVNVSWQADLWGKLNDQSSAALKSIEQQAILAQSVRDSLAAEIMKSWLSLIAQKNTIKIQQSRIIILEKNEVFIRQRYRSGLGDSEDLSSAKTATSTALATLAEQRESLRQQQRSFQNLLGRADRKEVNVSKQFPEVLLPLANLPEQSLRRRPDLKAAYIAIEIAELNSTVAYKELLPSISIKAALQEVADSPSAALLLNPVWSLLGQLTAPLYQGGQLRADVEIAKLQSASAYQGYRENLLTAVTEVEQSLSLESSLAQRKQHIEDALSNTKVSLSKYQNRYRSGLVSILDLLNVESNTYDLESQLNSLTLQRLSNRVDLGLALGLSIETGATK